MSHLITFPDPDTIFYEKPSLKKYFKYLTFFGPGAIIASMIIGQGQLIVGPQIGAWAGFALLWLVTLNIATYIIAYVGGRFTLLSGLSVMDVFAEKSKKGWVNWLFFLIAFLFLPLFAATIISTLGMSLSWIFGAGHYLIWGIPFGIFAALLTIIGKYKVVEYTQAFFVAFLGIGAIISLLVINIDVAEIVPHFFIIGDVPSYPEWVIEGYSDVAHTPIALTMLAYVGTMSVSLVGIVGYFGWMKVKRWGIFKDKDDPSFFSEGLYQNFKEKGKIEYLPKEKKEITKAKILLRPFLIDLAIAFIIVSIVSSSYMIAGKYLLGPREILPSNVDLIKRQAIIFSSIASWLKPIYQISIFFAFFGTIYAGFEAVSRMLYETVRPVSEKIASLSYKKFMIYLMAYLIIAGIPIAILTCVTSLSILLILSIFLLFIGIVGVIFYGIGILVINKKTLPAEYKPGKILVLLTLFSLFMLMIPFFFLFI